MLNQRLQVHINVIVKLHHIGRILAVLICPVYNRQMFVQQISVIVDGVNHEYVVVGVCLGADKVYCGGVVSFFSRRLLIGSNDEQVT
jgi:hypothetical protein